MMRPPPNSAHTVTLLPSTTLFRSYRRALIEGVEIAYREAGAPARPAVLLLHGFPTSSHMFRELIPALAERYHVLAPDYPGFGASAMPSVESFDYRFDTFARLMTALPDGKGIDRYAAYVIDYGAPRPGARLGGKSGVRTGRFRWVAFR